MEPEPKTDRPFGPGYEPNFEHPACIRAVKILKRAKALLEHGGWTPTRFKESEFLYGPEAGPWRLVQAVWRAGCYEVEGSNEAGSSKARIDVQGISEAARLLAACFKPRSDGFEIGWTDIGQWERAEGRTKEDVLKVVSYAAKLLGMLIRHLIEKVERGEAEEAKPEE